MVSINHSVANLIYFTLAFVCSLIMIFVACNLMSSYALVLNAKLRYPLLNCLHLPFLDIKVSCMEEEPYPPKT